MKQRFFAEALSAAILCGCVALRAQANQSAPPVAPPLWESCEEMHDYYVTRFEGSPGFGLSRMRQPPMLNRSGILDTGHVRYSVKSIELVGLLKQETPVAYVPSWHGGLIDADGYTRRELTGFEKATIAAFRAGKGLASSRDDESGLLVCIGALRAKDTCLNCHKDKKLGDLLGAFSYGLQPIKSAAPVTPALKSRPTL
jgi:hypothetical protein